MDQERLRWLFGDDVLEVIDEYDLDDHSDREALIEEYLPLPPNASERHRGIAVRTVVVAQILADDPPEVWAAVERMGAAGLDRHRILSQLTMALAASIQTTLDGDGTFDERAYTEALAVLPLPEAGVVAVTAIDVVRENPGIDVDEHIARTVERLSVRRSPLVEDMVERLVEDLVDGPLAWLPGDATVHVPDLFDGRIFTHRITEFELDFGALNVGFDLGALDRFADVLLADGTEIEQFSVERHHVGWGGPDGWLDEFGAGDLIGFSIAISEQDEDVFTAPTVTVDMRHIDPEPEASEDVITAVREAYEAIVAEPGLPVVGEELALWLCHHRSALFSEPQLPLRELCAAAGLELRGSQVAHDESIWRNDLFHTRLHRALDLVPEQEWQRPIGIALGVLDDPDASIEEVRASLDHCAEPAVLDALADVLFPDLYTLEDQHAFGQADAPGWLFELVDRATAVAKRPREIATAEYLACVLYERAGEPLIAEEHLAKAAQAAPHLGPVVERMGWYLFDRGDARGALRWWRRLDGPHPAAANIEPLAAAADGPKLGRNEPCWCGSGRKFKQCHQGAGGLPPLPDRVAWLIRKTTAWIEHSTYDVREIVAQHATAWATGDPDAEPGDVDPDDLAEAFAGAFADPILFDTAMFEGRLYGRFLAERGALLPEDEQLLIAAWMTGTRSVHEVVTVDPGVGLTLRDLATGDVVEVRERGGSRVMEVGERYCTRVGPDGATNQIVGGIFRVRAGEEAAVLDLCDDGDGPQICAWVGALHQPPRVVHSPGMLDSMLDRDAIQAVIDELGDDPDEDAVHAVLGAEISRQTQRSWLDEDIPALGGVTPRQAAADPTRREQLERLLDEFDRMNDQLEGSGGANAFRWDIAWLRRELGLDR